jgi:hypothetical protein
MRGMKKLEVVVPPASPILRYCFGLFNRYRAVRKEKLLGFSDQQSNRLLRPHDLIEKISALVHECEVLRRDGLSESGLDLVR